MSCVIDNGYTLGCSSVGGVEKVWVGTYDADTAYSLDSDNIITGVTSGQTVYLFEQDIEYAGLEQNGVFERGNGTVHYESILSVKFIDLDATLRNTALALGKAPIVAVVKSNSGNFYLLGKETAGRATEGNLSLGVALSDMNGANFSFTFKSQDGAFLIDEGLVPTGADGVLGA
jgi:hypothetical protein